MKRILVPISFSEASRNSLKLASSIYPKAHLTLVHIFPTQVFNRRFDFGKVDYNSGIIAKLKEFYTETVPEKSSSTTFSASDGLITDFIASNSNKYDLMVMSRKAHPTKKHGYLSDKKLFITTKAKCAVLILPITEEQFKFENCGHIWHIKRGESESELVAKWNKVLQIDQENLVEKSLIQNNYISAFWQNIVSYETTHNKTLLKKIDVAHDSEPIELLILVDDDASLFTSFFKSDTIRIFCKYDIPILILPTKT